MRKYFFTLTVIVCFLYGCSESSLPIQTKLDSSVKGKSIQVLRNQQLLLDLDVHSDGGYQWECQISDTNIIKKDSTHVASKNSDKNVVGGLAVETFYFSSNKQGECIINLIEHRGWEQNIPPINTVQFHVVVK